MPRRHPWLVLVLAVAALAACQPQRSQAPVADGTASGQMGNAGQRTTPRDSGQRPESAERVDQDRTGSRDSRAATQTARRPAPNTQRAPDDRTAADTADPGAPDIDPINANPQRFLGADGNGLTARLGRPTRQRVEAQARVWQYRLNECVLDVVLYPEGDGLRAAHLEARDRAGKAMPARRCLHALLNRQRETASAED